MTSSNSIDSVRKPSLPKVPSDKNGYHGNQHELEWTEQTRDIREFICGWGAAFVNISVTFPINKIMFRQQLHGVRSHKAIHQLRKEGFRQLYRGLLAPLLQKTTSMSLMFGLYYQFQREISHQFPSLWLPLNKGTAAMMAGTVEAVLTPFERVQVLMQDKNHHTRFNSTPHAFAELKPYGFREYYRGLVPILLRNGPSNIFFFLGREYLQDIYQNSDSQGTKVLLDFASGAVLGSLISTVFYPLNVVKVRMQCKVGGEFTGFIESFRLVLEERNYSLRKLFRGVHVNYTRAFISWGVVNATYELLMKHLFNGNHRKSGS